MKNSFYLIISLFVLLMVASCKDNKPKTIAEQSSKNADTLTTGDSTVYGTMVDGGMNSIILLTDKGDTIEFLVNPNDTAEVVKGGKINGDRFAIIDGTITSTLQSEKSPWTTWKIWNGKLILSKDTFTVDKLGAEALSLENKDGIFVFNRGK